MPFWVAQDSTPAERPSLKVMTLNIAHGRKEGPYQVFQRRNSIEANANDIATLLRRVQPDIVALQEADGPSIWSGNFNHVLYLAEKGEFPYCVQGEHVSRMKLHYGTALLSALLPKNPVSVTFAPSPPTFPKGFVVCTIQWPGDPDTDIDVVSVHLDFARRSVREKQVQQMATKLARRNRPLIVMGDFNCEWASKEQTLPMLAEKLNLRAYKPRAAEMDTFPSSQRRLDWILISLGIEFLTYKVLSDTVSDHLGLVAELGMVRGTT